VIHQLKSAIKRGINIHIHIPVVARGDGAEALLACGIPLYRGGGGGGGGAYMHKSARRRLCLALMLYVYG
jgi:hypothetical protein